MRTPVAFPLLCVIAKEQLLAEPSIDNGEWAERIKVRLVRLRLGYPDPPHRLTDAMDAVEHALAKEGRPRPLPRRLGPAPPPADVRPLSHDEARRALAFVGGLGLVKTMPKPRAITRRVVDLHAQSRMVAAAIVASVERCEALERAAADAAAVVPDPVEPGA
jgi:hypothetical protein